ncbi:MAG: DNA helicase [Alphaproteobacteria bacterium]|nr:DNA helicase [Alphaproteobacteria bacterium]
MKLTAPLHVLKGRAKDIKRAESIPLSAALDRIAKQEGYASWSLLQAKAKAFRPKNAEEVLDDLHPGDLLLVGARPGLGKTTLALQILLAGLRRGRAGFFFSLEYTEKSFAEKITSMGDDAQNTAQKLKTDFSEEISGDYIIRATKGVMGEGGVIAVDYLQLLDQRRDKPPLQQQVGDLKKHARAQKCSILFISQIDRNFDAAGDAPPALQDVRLPNPLDLTLFNKAVFVKDGRIYG